jgi:DNA-binding NarL/FixJ family response regulator
VHLLKVYSNLSPRAISSRELIFRSAAQARQQVTRATPRRARQLRADEIEPLVTRYLAVRNIRTVAREFQISRTTVARILAEHSIDTSHRMTEAQISVAAELYKQGLSSAAIGQQLGFDNHTILKALRGRSVAIRRTASPRQKDHTGGVT